MTLLEDADLRGKKTVPQTGLFAGCYGRANQGSVQYRCGRAIIATFWTSHKGKQSCINWQRQRREQYGLQGCAPRQRDTSIGDWVPTWQADVSVAFPCLDPVLFSFKGSVTAQPPSLLSFHRNISHSHRLQPHSFVFTKTHDK
jgi:hypothetical protein